MPLSELGSGDPELVLQRLETESLALTFLPGVGGRLLSLVADGRERLWVNPDFFDRDLRAVRARRDWSVVDGTFASWSNVGGSKTWPAPQGWDGDDQWPGPPDAVLDSGSWSFASWRSDDATIVRLVSPDDPRTGVRIERRFEVPDRGRAFRQHITFVNVGEREHRWSLWEVAQVPTRPGDRVEVDADSGAVTDLGLYRGRLDAAFIDGTITVPVARAVGKLGFPSATGRVALPGMLELRFAVQPGDYPDQGSRAEVWLQSPTEAPIAELSGLRPTAWLAELEVLSPRRTLSPGESATAVVDWLVP